MSPSAAHDLVIQAPISSPKRTRFSGRDWEGFFGYYAGFPESFSRQILSSFDLPRSARILDPWNGSGTTTFSAYSAGYRATGIDINPVMIITARARMLRFSEVDAILPLGAQILRNAAASLKFIAKDDPFYNGLMNRLRAQ